MTSPTKRTRSAKPRARTERSKIERKYPTKEATMGFEYLLVIYKDHRIVMANDTPVGVTGHILILPPGDYIINLDGMGYSPDHQDVELGGTSPVRPAVVVFL